MGGGAISISLVLTVPIKMPSVLRTELARRPQLVSHTVVTANANRPSLSSPGERQRVAGSRVVLGGRKGVGG